MMVNGRRLGCIGAKDFSPLRDGEGFFTRTRYVGDVGAKDFLPVRDGVGGVGAKDFSPVRDGVGGVGANNYSPDAMAKVFSPGRNTRVV